MALSPADNRWYEGRVVNVKAATATIRFAGDEAGQAIAPPSEPPVTVSLADARFDTGRPLAPPDSSHGGETTCIVCFSQPKTHAAVPCGHRCACGPCSAKMSLCPYCRGTVMMWMETRDV